MAVYRLEELFPEEIEARLREYPLLVLPFGTIEWHSYHLPLGLDGIVAQALAMRIAERLGAVLAPVSYWAVGGVPYPFTLDLSIEVIEPLLISVFEQFGAMGFKVIAGLTGHFGLAQTLVFKRAALTVMRRSPVTILAATEYEMTTDAGYQGDHAAAGESSLLWSVREDLVRLNNVAPEKPLDGIIGADPRGTASPEQGREFFDRITSRTAEVAHRLLKETSAQQRAGYIQALEAGVRVLAKMQQQREDLPKSQVPSLMTPAYLDYCQAMYRGDYPAARASAERKFQNLSH